VMPYISVHIKIYKSLGYTSLTSDVIVGDHSTTKITKKVLVELFSKMVRICRSYNHSLSIKKVKDDTEV